MKDYYKELDTLIEELEVNKRYRQIKDNSETLRTYWHIGKLIVDAQGDKRAKYGTNFVQEWSVKLVNKYGKGYDYTNLSRMKKSYLYYPFFCALRQELSWTHYRYILPLKNENERN